VEGNRRRAERGLDHPAERQAGVGEQDQAVNAAARQGFPGEGEGGLFAGVRDPKFQQARTQSGPVSAGVGRRSFEQELAVAVVAEQIGEDGEERGQHDGEQGGARQRSPSGDDGFPEFDEPEGRPPGGTVRLASEKRKRADGGNEQGALDEEGDAEKPASGDEIEQYALQGQQGEEYEGTGAGERGEGG
jgi:hypothetical protein